jgi:tetratricopeptide (TPR) repeat protein
MSIPFTWLPTTLLAVMAALLLGSCGYSDELHQRHSLLKLLWEERYAELDQAITQAYRERDKGKLSSNQLRTRIWQLQSVAPDFAPRFDSWVARQQSSHAYLARGWYRIEQASKIRGDGPASGVPPDRYAKVRELAELGIEDMRQALAKDSRCAMCIGGEIFANLYLGRRDDELLERAFLIDPTLWQPVAAHFISLYPQWGGSEEEMKAFIHRMGTLTRAEKVVQRLNAMFYFQRGLIQQFELRDYMAAIKEYETAISYFPDSFALKNIATIYSNQGRYDKAAEALERNLRDNDEWDLYTIEALAQAYFAQGKRGEGEKMIKRRVELLTRFRNGE